MTETAVVKYDITDKAVAEMKSFYMGLTISDMDDKEQFDTVHDARMVVKTHRVAVEKRRKELKADAISWGRKVDTEAKRIFGMLEPIESHLMAEENKVLEEQKRIKEGQDRVEREKIQDRVNSLQMFGAVLPFQEVALMSDEEFETILEGSRVAFVAEQKRLSDEAAARKAEDERLAAERAELEKQRKEQEEKDAARKEFNDRILAEQKAAQDKINTERKALEDEKEAERNRVHREKMAEQERKDRIAFEAKAKEDAKIQAEKDAIEVAEQAEKYRLAKIEAEKAEAARQKALLPDKTKLTEWIEMVRSVPEPEIKDNDAKIYLSGAVDKISEAMEVLLVKIERL